MAGFWVWWSAFDWLGCYGFAGFIVGTWWVLFCFIILGFLVPVGFCCADDSGGVVAGGQRCGDLHRDRRLVGLVASMEIDIETDVWWC